VFTASTGYADICLSNVVLGGIAC